MTTYSIDPNSHRIDKTNFPTKDEAISRAQECARMLNRGVSVYEVEEPGTNTQEKDYPKVTSPITHIAFVLPDGTIKKGIHPAVKLLEENPEDEELHTYPYALGCLSSLVRTLDAVARTGSISRDVAAELFAVADAVQNRVLESQAVVATALVETADLSGMLTEFSAAFTPNTVFRSSTTNTTVQIVAFDKATQIVVFRSSATSTRAVPSVLQARAHALAKVLLNGGFEIENPAATEPAAKSYNQPNPQLQPVVRTHDDDKKIVKNADDGKTLEDQLKDASSGDSTTILSFCMGLCDDDIAQADELATAFLDAFKTKTTDRRTLASELRIMKSYCGHILPQDWFVKAQRIAVAQLSSYRPNIAVVPPHAVVRTAASAMKTAQDRGIKLPKIVRAIAPRIARGDALDLHNLEKIKLHMQSRFAETKPLEYAAWGGQACKNWIHSVFENFPTPTN